MKIFVSSPKSFRFRMGPPFVLSSRGVEPVADGLAPGGARLGELQSHRDGVLWGADLRPAAGANKNMWI